MGLQYYYGFDGGLWKRMMWGGVGRNVERMMVEKMKRWGGFLHWTETMIFVIFAASLVVNQPQMVSSQQQFQYRYRYRGFDWYGEFWEGMLWVWSGLGIDLWIWIHFEHFPTSWRGGYLV